MIHNELKKAITEYFLNNMSTPHSIVFNRLNNAIDNFREYIYNSEGNYLIGGKEVIEFIEQLDKLL